MSRTQPTVEDSTARGVAIDVRANDLTHIGTDDLGAQHYYDAQRDRIVVVETTAEEYTREGSALVRSRLVADASEVVDVIDAGGKDPSDYVEYVADHVDTRDWAAIQLTEIDVDALVGAA